MLIKNKIIKISIIIFFIFINGSAIAQHNGDNSSFQGLFTPAFPDAKSIAMGGAVNSLSGELFNLYYNPAGLAALEKFNINVQGNFSSKLYRENQVWRPNRLFVTLPALFEGLIIWDKSYSGKTDAMVYKDSNYIVSDPNLGKEPFSSEAADWEMKKNALGLNSFTLGFPFKLFNLKFGIAAGYNRTFIFDYDRNDTYLTPHTGSFDYGKMPVANGNDSALIKWSRFYRDRFGYMNKVNLGIGAELIQQLKLGFNISYNWGNSDDYQYLYRFGNITLLDQNSYRFTYVNSNTGKIGSSKYNSLFMSFGAIATFERVNISLKVDLPYTFKREYNYSRLEDTVKSVTDNTFKDEIKLPAVLTFGISISPINSFTLSCDYEYAPYSKTEYNLAEKDTMFRKFLDRSILKFGARYKATKFLTFYAGYTNIPELFYPDGTDNNEAGPSSENYSFGFSIISKYGTLDVAYQWGRMKYYDQYYSNTNYATEITNKIYFGYSYTF